MANHIEKPSLKTWLRLDDRDPFSFCSGNDLGRPASIGIEQNRHVVVLRLTTLANCEVDHVRSAFAAGVLHVHFVTGPFPEIQAAHVLEQASFTEALSDEENGRSDLPDLN
jgi:hypothetical protein